jgi:hypothetical protein
MIFLSVSQTQKQSAPLNSSQNFEKNEYKHPILSSRNPLARITMKTQSLDTLWHKI